MFRQSMGTVLFVVMSSALVAGSLRAQTPEFRDPVEQHWRPLSQAMTEKGVTLEVSYTADFLVNTRGGIDTSNNFQYRGLLDVGLTFDTETMGLWPGGTFFANFIDNHGIDISERYVGDLQAVNNADAPNDSRLYEMWYEQALFDDRLRIKLGKLDVNADFAAGVYRDEFLHASAGFSPTIPMITWPDTALGVVVMAEPTDWLYVGAGTYDAEGTATRGGFETAFHAPDETFTIVELGVRPRLSLFGHDDLPGQYAVGGYYHSGTWPILFNDLDGRLAPRFATGNSGLYVTMDQRLTREADDPEQGLGAFFQFAWAPSDRNEITQHYGGGFQYYGPLPTRDADVLGLGVHHVSLAGEIQEQENRHAETAVELFYRMQLTDWLSVKPDMQYIIDPGGQGRDALVAGVRLEFAL